MRWWRRGSCRFLLLVLLARHAALLRVGMRTYADVCGRMLTYADVCFAGSKARGAATRGQKKAFYTRCRSACARRQHPDAAWHNDASKSQHRPCRLAPRDTPRTTAPPHPAPPARRYVRHALGAFQGRVTAGAESRMLTYADVCRRMLTYADVC